MRVTNRQIRGRRGEDLTREHNAHTLPTAHHSHSSPPTSRARRAAAVVLAIGLLAACGGARKAATSTTVSAPSATAASTTASTRSTTSPPASTTAASTSVSPVTTPATTTSTTAPVEEQVRVAASRFYDYYWQCLRKPAECDASVVSPADSDAFRSLTKTAADLVKGGFFVGAEDPGYMAIESIEQSPDHVLVTSCWWLTAVLYGPPAAPGGEPLVQNDTHGSSRQADQYVPRADGSWALRHSDTLTPANADVGVNTCPAKS